MADSTQKLLKLPNLTEMKSFMKSTLGVKSKTIKHVRGKYWSNPQNQGSIKPQRVQYILRHFYYTTM